MNMTKTWVFQSRLTELLSHCAASLRCAFSTRATQLLAAILMMMGAHAAHATCTVYTGDGAWNRPTNATLSGTVNVASNAAIGTVLATFTANSWGNLKIIECAPNQTDSTRSTYASMPHAVIDASNGIFESGIPGVGIQVTRGSGSSFPVPTASPNAIGGIASGIAYASPSPQYIVKFIKTGPMQTSGIVSASDVPVLQFSLVSNSQPIYYLGVTGSVTFTVPGCTVNTPNVSLRTHSMSEFQGVGSTTAPVPFSVQLTNCPQAGGVYYQMDAVNGYAAQPQSVVNLQSGGATGIGVQLLDSTGSTIVPMGTAQTLTTNGSLNYTIPFQARYYQTSSAVTAGVANTAMTITMTYQ